MPAADIRWSMHEKVTVSLKPQSLTERSPRHRRWLRLAWLLLLLPVVAVLAERWRGQWALHRWKSEMMARGERFEPTALWPPSSSRSVEFSNQLAQAIGKLPRRMNNYAGQMQSIVMVEPGKCRRGSQESQPRFRSGDSPTNTWLELEELFRQSQPALQSLRALMKDPPPDPDYDIVRCLENNSFPNFASARIGAQSLQAAAMNDLHQGDLAGAGQDLEALLSLVKVHEKDPTLVSYMIRIAILGLSVDVCWDALQAGGWTEPQLAALRRACLDTRQILGQMPRTLEAERAGRVAALRWFRSHSYNAWLARNPIFVVTISGNQHTAEQFVENAFVRFSRQWLLHPLWSFAWADQEDLEYLRRMQCDIEVLRETTRQRSLRRLEEQLAANRKDYRPPAPAWRFYIELPAIECFWGEPAYPCRYIGRPWSTTMGNLTLHEMVITAIALKRYELKHGQPPASLAALVPAFLSDLPCDYMDGQTLRYRLDSDHSFTLYSVGADMRDDGGDALPESADSDSPWTGKDWVWPKAVEEVQAQQKIIAAAQ
jgi:hypothetical protein